MSFSIDKILSILNIKPSSVCSGNEEGSNTSDTLNNLFEYDTETGSYKINNDAILNKEEFVKALIENDSNADLTEEELGLLYDTVASKDGEEGLSEEELKWLAGLGNAKEEELGTVINGNGINELDIQALVESEDITINSVETQSTVIIPNDQKSAAEENDNTYTYSDSETKDGQISETEQSKTGDCWLLSDINALSYTEEGQKIIENALEYQDGYTTVHLFAGDVIVTDEELKEAKESDYYATGDDDVIILELAIEAVRDAIANGGIEVAEDYPYYDQNDITETTTGNSSLNKGLSSEAIYLLTGIKYNNYVKTNNADEINNELNKYIENESKDYVLTVGTKEDISVTDINGKELNLNGPHAYAVKSADENTITITDPWDSSEEIVITREEFIEKFSYLMSVDLSDVSNTDYLTVVNEEEINSTE